MRPHAPLRLPRHPNAVTWFCLAVGLALVPGLVPTPAAGVDIGDLHCNDSSGRPRSPYTIGTAVTVSGIVTAGSGTFASYTDVWIQDATGGIEVYANPPMGSFALGDSVTVHGTIGQYRGNTEVMLGSWSVHGGGHTVPEPKVLTCYELAHLWQADYCEPDESRLVRIDNVSLAGSWPSGSEGGAVTISDATGSCTLYIDADTGLQYMPAPGGNFDVVGIAKQFAGYNPPFNTGYQIIPRTASDFIPGPGPQIVAGPVETQIGPEQITIVWTTDVPADSRVEYGLTSGYEIGAVEDPAMVTEHAITLSGLDPATIHHYRVVTANDNGETQSGDKLFCSASGPESTGEIRLWFNKSVETALALGTPAQGNVNLLQPLIERIDAAEYSIDVAIYSFDIAEVADALIAAKARGVAIRFVYENRDTYQSQVQRLQQAGIVVIDDAYGPNNGGGGLMHNKFWIFDARNGSPDGSDDWIWTGSLNLTSGGTFTDAQNVIAVQDAALAAAYTAELDEMWGSTADTPDPDASRFGTRKLDDTPKRFVVGGVSVEAWFSPSDGVVETLIREAEAADASMHFCILSYTRDDLAAAMQEPWYGDPGFELRGVFDSAEGGSQYSEYQPMKGTGGVPWDPPADVWLDGQTGSLHHKYLIVDANRHGLEPTVVTGSANWSTAGTQTNDENILVIRDFAVANQYFQEFAARYHIAGGTGNLTVGAPEAPLPAVIAAGPRLQAWPNPASGAVSVVCSSPVAGEARVSLFGADGRLEAVLYRGPLSTGMQRLDFDLRELEIPAGVHFLRLETPAGSRPARLLVVR